MTMQEYITNAPVTVEQVQRKVMDFVEDRKDVVIIGSWAVNLQAQNEEQRQTSDIDLTTMDKDLHILLIAYIFANLGIHLTIHSQYPDLIRLYSRGLNQDRPIVDIVYKSVDWEIKEGLRVATIDWLIKAKKKAIASPLRAETKRLVDQRDLLVLEAARKED